MEKSKVIGVLAIAGAAIAGLGTLLPFVTMQTIFGSISVNFIDGDGKLVIAAAVVVAIGGIAYLLERRLWALVCLATLAGLGVLFYDSAKLSDGLAKLQGTTGIIQVGPGIGLYLCWIGLLTALIAGVWGFLARSEPKAIVAVPVPASI
jgi:hypothetical protein